MSLPPPPAPPVSASSTNLGLIGQPMVEVTNVSKVFGDVVAVSDVSFTVGPGVTALLGPNGAGKSTLFRMLCGLTPPSKGEVRVLGSDARRDREVRGRIGLIGQHDGLFDRMSAGRFVEIAAATHGMVDPVRVAAEVLADVELDPDDPKPVGDYSKGMRQRVKVAAGLVNDPDVLVLDEPLTGLDPVQRRRMIALFHRLGDEGRCVLVSSHVLDEVARLGSRVLVIAQGRLAAAGDYRALRDLMDDRPHRIRLGTDDPRGLAARLIDTGSAVAVRLEPGGVVADILDVDKFGRSLAPMAREAGIRLREVVPLDDDLESVFRYLVERR